MHDHADPELLATWQDGNREAYAVLVARYEGLVRAACRRQAPSADIEDCVQAVFLVLARRPGAAARAPALAAWLLRVAGYVCRKAQRSTTRRQRAERGAAAPTETHPRPPSEALDHLDACLAKLPEKQRVAISLQFLAGKEPDAVAAALDTSRENAYQLVSRGLTTLRALLARRGVAITAPALLAVLAGESQAATTATGTTALATSLCTTPTANAAALASGATTAMTLAATAPFAIAAGLLLPVAVTATLLAAEPAPKPAPKTTPSPTATAPTDKQPTWLDQEVTLDFQNQELLEVVVFVQRITGASIVLDPRCLESAGVISLKVTSMKFSRVLDWIEKLSGTTHTFEDGIYGIHLPQHRFGAAEARAAVAAEKQSRSGKH